MLEISKEDAQKLIHRLIEDSDAAYGFTFFELFVKEREKHPRASFEWIYNNLPTYTEDVHDKLCSLTMVKGGLPPSLSKN